MEDLQPAENAAAKPGANGESDVADDGNEPQEEGSGAGKVSHISVLLGWSLLSSCRRS